MKFLNHPFVAEEEELSPMTEAAESLVHFASGTPSSLRTYHDDDGLTDLEIARTVSLCVFEAAC